MRENYLFIDFRREKCLFCKLKVYKEEGGKGGRGREKGSGRGKKEREGRRKERRGIERGKKEEKRIKVEIRFEKINGCIFKSNGVYRK